MWIRIIIVKIYSLAVSVCLLLLNYSLASPDLRNYGWLVALLLTAQNSWFFVYGLRWFCYLFSIYSLPLLISLRTCCPTKLKGCILFRNIHLLIILLILSACHVIHPFLVVEVPAHCLLNAFFKLKRWSPCRFL